MFSDAVLEIVTGTDAKWLYNASRRLKRPLSRSAESATWWRLTHHLSGKLGLRLGEAARAADALLSHGSELARTRLRVTPDDAVSIGVDLGRFRDGTALSIAAALHLAVPRKRGRRSLSPGRPLLGMQPPAEPLGDPASRLMNVLATLIPSPGEGLAGSALTICAALAGSGIPFVFVGDIAASFHGGGMGSRSIDLIADFAARHALSLSQVLNRFQASPRGVSIRESFCYDALLVRSAPCLALRFAGVDLNVHASLPGLGEFAQACERSETVRLEGLTYRVLASDACLDTVLARQTGVG